MYAVWESHFTETGPNMLARQLLVHAFLAKKKETRIFFFEIVVISVYFWTSCFWLVQYYMYNKQQSSQSPMSSLCFSLHQNMWMNKIAFHKQIQCAFLSLFFVEGSSISETPTPKTEGKMQSEVWWRSLSLLLQQEKESLIQTTENTWFSRVCAENGISSPVRETRNKPRLPDGYT